MGNLKVNTDLVVGSAEKINTLNSQMRDEFASVDNAITQLDNSWDGAAATKAMSKFKEIKSGYFNARYNVLNNYVRFLLDQVGEGYTQTENVNISLADKFK